MRVLCVLALAAVAFARDTYLLDYGWKFELQAPVMCPAEVDVWPYDLTGMKCSGAYQSIYQINSEEECKNACCKWNWCELYQWNGGCNVGLMSGCEPAAGYKTRGRNATSPPFAPPSCTEAGCSPQTNDASWRSVNLPHDFVVEGDFAPLYSNNATETHGFLPYGNAWYRKHISFPDSAQGATIWVDFEAIQTTSTVYFNGQLLGYKAFGYTNSRYFIDSSKVNFGASADNVLAVHVNGSVPDSWWYDGGGIYRHVWLTVVPTTGPYISPWGVYAPTNVTGPITWGSDGTPISDALLMPSVEVWTNASSPSSQPFSLTLTVTDAKGNTVGTASGNGAVTPGTPTFWTPSAPIIMKAARLWHLVSPPTVPSLYTLAVTLLIDGVAIDSSTVTFGARSAYFDAANGFVLNGVPMKIQGTANHQDAAGVGVAVPDHLQAWRVAKLKEMGVNGWRTAHNPPNPALLDAADTLGMVVWDETHRNGNLPELEIMIRRDRNHPSIVIWSLCNEVLCQTADNWVTNALAAKALIQTLDPLGARAISANQNGWIGPNTPLTLQGFDYTPSNYDQWHKSAPNIPSISSESSAAYNDRGVYANNASGGYVSGYDVNNPGFGELAEGAWGGLGIKDGQGILTRPFISGGFTWTGHEYRGEPAPYGWPCVNSHYGTLDMAGFPKDRFFYYKAWFIPNTPSLHLFPHWNWAAGDKVNLWAYTNADFVELFVNSASLGIKNVTQFGHVEWDAVPFVPGAVQAVGYKNGQVDPVVDDWRNTTGAAAALSIAVKDGVGEVLYAGCQDIAYVQVDVVDAEGNTVPTANNDVTFTLSGVGTLVGTANGDPSGHVNNLSPSRPAFAGLVLAVVTAGDVAGTATLTASSPGLASATLTLTVAQQPTGFNAFWCPNGPRL